MTRAESTNDLQVAGKENSKHRIVEEIQCSQQTGSTNSPIPDHSVRNEWLFREHRVPDDKDYSKHHAKDKHRNKQWL